MVRVNIAVKLQKGIQLKDDHIKLKKAPSNYHETKQIKRVKIQKYVNPTSDRLGSMFFPKNKLLYITTEATNTTRTGEINKYYRNLRKNMKIQEINMILHIIVKRKILESCQVIVISTIDDMKYSQSNNDFNLKMNT